MKLIRTISNLLHPVTTPISNLRFFTWKGRDVTYLKNEHFLSHTHWQRNLNLLANFSIVSPHCNIMTKEMYQWLPKNSCVNEGYNNLKERLENLSSLSFSGWLTFGAAMSITFLFIQAIQLNFNCLNKYELINDDIDRECRHQYAEILEQPGLLAQFAVVAGFWTFVGWLINNLGDFGLKGNIAQYRLHKDIIAIYITTADNARRSFWEAYDNNDQATVLEIYQQLAKIQLILPFLKKLLSTELSISNEEFTKMTNHLKLAIEDVTCEKTRLGSN